MSISSEFSLLSLVKTLRVSPELPTAQDFEAAFSSLVLSAPVTVAAFLTLLSTSGLESSPVVLAAAAKSLRLQSVPLAPVEGAVDIVGTGGDGKDTFNVSTCAAILASGAGVKVVKHGNKASTSSSGSSDLLMELGYDLNFPLENIPQIMQRERGAFVFLHAARFHPTLAALAPLRKELGFRTIFNLLGPLLNPARPARMILGVPTPELGEPFALALRELKVSGMVVCGDEGLDEISCAGPSHIWMIDHINYSISKNMVEPADFGLQAHTLQSVKGGPASQNAAVFRHILDPTLPVPEGVDILAVTDYILMNAAALLVVSGKSQGWKDGMETARQCLRDGGTLLVNSGFYRP